VHPTAATSLASPSSFNFLPGGIAMLRHADRPTIAPVIRSAFTLALASALLYSLVLRQAIAAPQTVARDPQALNLIASSLKALTGGVAASDVILQASAAYVAGSDEESGTATLTARGNQQSLVQLNLSGGPRQEIRNGPAGAWSGPDATAHSTATHNCWTDASWFFPALTLEAIANNPQTNVSYLGTDTSKGRPLLHVQATRVPPGQMADVTALILRLAAMDVYFDPQSLLPVVLDFNAHPDADAGTNLPIEIQFSNFQSISGGLVPFRIQKYLQGSLLLDLVVTNVSINSGVPQGVFTLPPTTGGGQ
jgi:hypothetical protein